MNCYVCRLVVLVVELHDTAQHAGPVHRLVQERDDPPGPVATPLPCRILHRLQGIYAVCAASQ